MHDRLTELFQGVAVAANADLEHRAALELLVLVMASDHVVDQNELDTIRDISVGWRDDDVSYDKYLTRALELATEAIQSDTVIDMVEDIDSRISSRILRLALFSAAREVAGFDDDVSPEEGSLLAEIAVRFG
jgi:uncharacterized tellurite resistance protein B-like protein